MARNTISVSITDTDIDDKNMKKRPQYWHELPYTIAERIAGDCELDYDGYESSYADALSTLMCNSYDKNNLNWKIVQSRYQGINDDDLRALFVNVIEMLRSETIVVEDFLTEMESDIE
jgi:hypothetical protein